MRLFPAILAAALLLRTAASAGVVINEFMASPSDRQLTWDSTGEPALGSGHRWQTSAYSDNAWSSGNLPAGYGVAGLSTNLAATMQNKTPNLYLRKTFTVTAGDAASTQPLSLLVESNDGFICWINGKEVARANMGPPKHFVFHDQAAYNPETRNGLQEYPLGAANTLLVTGDNLIAIQAANSNTPPTAGNQSWTGQTPTFSLNAGLRFVGPTVTVTPLSLNFNNATGGSLTHTNNAGSLTNTPAGTNAPNGWLATMAASPASSATGSLTAAITENATAGIGNGGGLKFDFAQTGAVASFTTYAPPVNMTGGWAPGGVNANALNGTTLRLRFRNTGGAQLGLRIDPAVGQQASTIDGFPIIGAPAAPPPDYTWDAASGGTFRWTINATGGGSSTTTGTRLGNFFFFSAPDLRSGQYTLKEDSAIASPASALNGVLSLTIDTLPSLVAGGSQTWWGWGLQTLGMPEWSGVTLTQAMLTNARLKFKWKLTAGKKCGFRLEPIGTSDGYGNRCDFTPGAGFTGTGNWETFDQPLSAGTNLAPFVSAMNGLAAKNIQFVMSDWAPIGTYAAGDTMLLDDINLYVESATATAENPAITLSSAANAYRQQTVSGGTATTTQSGTPLLLAYLFADSAANGLQFRLNEDSTAGAGNAGSTGHLRLQTVTAATAGSFMGFNIPNIEAKSWSPGALTADTAGLVTLRLAVNIPVGETWTFWAEPGAAGGYNNRADFGSLAGTGAWQIITREFAAAGNLAAFITSMNAQNTNKFLLVFSGPPTLAAGDHIRLDDIELLPWTRYEINLGAGNQPGNRFVNALNGTNSISFVPTLYKTQDFAAGSSLTLDNFEISYTGSDPALIRDIIPAGSAGGAWRQLTGRYEPSGGVVDPGLVTGTFAPPVGEEADFSEPAAFTDWIELYNNGGGSVDLSNWALSDEPVSAPGKWRFPAGTSIPAGGYLIVMCDDREEANAPAGPAQRLHASFTLSDDGERVALFDSALTPVDEVPLPVLSQVFFCSWGRTPSDSALWGFLPIATPGAANAGISYAARAEAPDFFDADGVTPLPGGRYATNQTLVLTTLTPGAAIRYTLNGSDPTDSNGSTYTAPLTVTRPNGRTAVVVRARTMAPGMLASGVKTQTYLINQDAAISGVPAILFTGSPGRTFYKPEGLLAIQGGAYGIPGGPSDIWLPNGPASYNVPVGRGQAFERETRMEWYFNPGYYPNPAQQPLNMDFGLRVSSSPYSRPRLTMSNTAASPFNPGNANEKCSWNLFFRGDFGAGELDYPIFPGYNVRNFQNLRLRAGKNDIDNPHITDEMFRRIFFDMGHVTARGLVCSMYINGVYKGVYNLAERVREPMFQEHYRSENIWEVRYVNEWVDGLPTEIANGAAPPSWNNLNTVVNNTAAANYWSAVQGVLEPDNFADYYLFNIYTSMWDWPWNNYVFYRERAAGPDGRFRFTVWDAEGACYVKNYYTDYVTNGVKNQNYNSIALDLTGRDGYDLPRLFSRLRTNSEWRLKFADRVNRQMFNNGALDDRDPDAAGPLKSMLKTRLDELVSEAGPQVQYTTGQVLATAWFNTWVNTSTGRRSVVLPKGTNGVAGYTPGHLRAPTGVYNAGNTFWPETEPPVFSPHGGTLAAGATVTMTGSVGNVPGGVDIYYTTDGSDPRLAGGALNPAAITYSSPVVLNQIVTLKARSRNSTTSEWSPLTEATYLVDAVPATAANLVVAEIMYHPADASAAEVAAGYNNADDFEFLRLMNIGAAPVTLQDVKFNVGISFDANTASSIAAINPGQSALLVRRKDAFEFRYGTAFSSSIAGEFTGGLSNSGEQLTITGPDGADADTLPDTIKNFAYSDVAPWPQTPDGDGPSLVLIAPATNPDHNLAASWTATAWPGGLVAAGGANVPWTYQQWRNLLWGATNAADNSISGPDADPDGDGLNNRIEYGLGGNPKSSDASLLLPRASVTSAAGQNYLTVEYRTPAGLPASTVTPQLSTDLSTWSGGLIQVSSTANPDGTITRRFRDPISITTGQRTFIRLLITLP